MPQFLSAVANSLPSIMPNPPKAIADRNVQNVVLGDIFFTTWYPSFYPEELVGRDTDRLYVCRWCFKYSKEVMPFSAHVVSRPNRLYTASSCSEKSIVESVSPQGQLSSRHLDLHQRRVLYLRNGRRRTQG